MTTLDQTAILLLKYILFDPTVRFNLLKILRIFSNGLAIASNNAFK